MPSITGPGAAASVAPGCGGYSRKQVDDLTQLAKQFGAGGLVSIIIEPGGTYKSSIQRYLTDEQVAQIRQRTGAGEGDRAIL